MAFKLQLPLCACMLLLVTVIPLATAQSLQLVYIRRSGNQPGANRIFLECRRNSIAVPNPQIFVERSDLPRQLVGIVGNQNGQVTIVINQDLEGLYSCSDNGDRSTNLLALVAYPQTDPTTTSYAFQAGLAATINCQIMPGRLSQYYSIRWMNGSLTIATSTPRTSSRSVLPGYQLHDNFSLTINDAQPSDSSTSYRCSVTIDDPQISGTDNIIYGQLSSITVNVYVPPHIRIPPEQQVIAVVGNDQPNTTFICEATRISACSTQISWIHNGRNTSQTINRRFQADITGINDGTIRSRLNANHLMGSDSGTVGCVAYCMVDIPSQKELLVLSTSRYTTLSVLTTNFETVVTITTDGDMFIRITFRDGYRIPEQTRLLMKYTDERSTRSRNMTSEQAFVNASRILLEVPRSRLPYERFRVDVALQVGDAVGQFVSDDKIHDTTERSEETIQLGIIVGSSVGGVVLIAALLTCCVCLIVSWRIHAHAKIDRTIVKVVVFKHYEGNSPDEMEEELEKYFKQKRVTDDGGDEEAQRQKAQEEAQKQTILDKFIKDMHKRRC